MAITTGNFPKALTGLGKSKLSKKKSQKARKGKVSGSPKLTLDKAKRLFRNSK